MDEINLLREMNWEIDRLREVVLERERCIAELEVEKYFLQKKITKLQEEVLLLREQIEQSTPLSPSQVCRKYNFQCCHSCEDADCGDNQTPSIVALKQRIKELEAETKRLNERLKRAAEQNYCTMCGETLDGYTAPDEVRIKGYLVRDSPSAVGSVGAVQFFYFEPKITASGCYRSMDSMANEKERKIILSEVSKIVDAGERKRVEMAIRLINKSEVE